MLIFYAKTYGDGPFRKIRVYLISRFFSIRENFMLAKYTWFTVYCFEQPTGCVSRLKIDFFISYNLIIHFQNVYCCIDDTSHFSLLTVAVNAFVLFVGIMFLWLREKLIFGCFAL